MKKTFSIIVTSIAILSAAQASILLTNFGSIDTTIDPSTNITYTLNSSSTAFSNITDNSANQITWVFNTPFTLSNINSQNLFLNFSLSGTNPNSAFHIDLYSNGGAFYTFSGTTTTASSSASDIALTYVGNTGGAFSSFAAVMLGFDGSGSTITAMTVSNLNYSAVPEPSTYALLAVVGLFLTVFSCRRKTQV